jgi:hypothetical protein
MDAQGVAVDITLGAGKLDRHVRRADELLIAYREDDGLRYLNHQAVTPSNELLPEDLAVTILINSQVGPAAFKSVQDLGPDLDLDVLPNKRLEDSTENDRQAIAEVIAEVAGWPGFAASVATKVLHKKRPGLIPILDNQAIFGAYMNPRWRTERSSTASVYSARRIGEAVEWITFDLNRSENAKAWSLLKRIETSRSLIEVFDMVWWMYFRSLEPVRPPSPV